MANDILSGAGVHHVALMSSDFEASLAFYKGLGMKETARWGSPERTIAMLDIGNGSHIELFSNGGDEYAECGKYAHLALSVENVDAAYELALSLGATPLTPPKSIPLDSAPAKMTIRIAFVHGPSGEQLEFFKVG